MDGRRFCNGFSIEDATNASFAECTLLAAGGCLQRLIHDVYRLPSHSYREYRIIYIILEMISI